MQFYQHRNLEGLHAPFSPSQPHWLRYDDDKVAEVYTKKKSAELGTKLHKWAQDTIRLGIKQQRSKKTLCAYVNDAIGFKMDTEVVLFHSERFFGTADSISFRQGPEGRYMLRIHDLKTGTIPASMEQLEVYAALFCLEYKVKPRDIDMELRIYQNDEVVIHIPTAEDIEPIMEKIVHIDKLLEEIDNREVI
jgi:hypothetical protein